MWDRKELKARGKAAFQANYWRAVLVALIIVAVTGGGAGAAARNSNGGDANVEYTVDDGFQVTYPRPNAVLGGLAASVLGLSALAAFALDILVLNPLQVGCRRFFTVNSAAPADLDELGFGFRGHYRNTVVTMLLRDVYLGLWFLLFVIPGIIKAYSYRMVPYILAEQPDIAPKDAITLSRQLMDGHKWNAFVLDLSFIGWWLLTAVTAGIVGVFYVQPYVFATDAELYLALKRRNWEIE